MITGEFTPCFKWFFSKSLRLFCWIFTSFCSNAFPRVHFNVRFPETLPVVSHAQLRDALGVSFHEAEKIIKDHDAGHDFPIDEFEDQRAFLLEAKQQ